MTTKLDRRFFDSTRGRIVQLVRGSKKTVTELSNELGLTDNAVRAHLLSLERDGIIRQSGMQAGTRKPHFAYELTDEADNLFPKAYDALLVQLITVLKAQLKPEALDQVLREVGRSLAGGQTPGAKKDALEHRAGKGLAALEAIGGAAYLHKEDDRLFIRSASCPLATAVAEHPEVCQLAETLLSEIIGAKVQERCDRSGPPRCSFEIVKNEKRGKRKRGGSGR